MIRVDHLGDVCTITLDRPDKANALTREMLLDVAVAVDQAAGTKALILTGTGRVFSAGADLEATKAGLATDPAWEKASGAIAGFDGLTVAALNGTVAGGAFGVVLACDMRLAVPNANFFYPVMKMGFLPQPSDPGRMAALIGPSRAKMILMSGQKISAEEALSWGLIDRIVPQDDLIVRAQDLCRDALTAEAGHIARIKHMIPRISEG
ncbi:enoyl-CoA hydratase/isomerase family protein [Yoonia sp. 2307UL14-13]|uniref:enoyl-CoA hydratase/isomerase family protein n=1 Tax=Yoonia sp. 2307UL14-13 TaxID=3126506 RepID=UPI0030A06321